MIWHWVPFGMKHNVSVKEKGNSLGKRSWLVSGRLKSPRGKATEWPVQHPVMTVPVAVLHSGWVPRQPQSPSWGVSPFKSFDISGCKAVSSSPLPGVSSWALRGLLGFLGVRRGCYLNQVPWKLVPARSHFWIPFSSLVKSFWSVSSADIYVLVVLAWKDKNKLARCSALILKQHYIFHWAWVPDGVAPPLPGKWIGICWETLTCSWIVLCTLNTDSASGNFFFPPLPHGILGRR